MAEDNKTTLENKCSILSDLWTLYRDDEVWAEFIEFSDIGLPLAYMVDSGILSPSILDGAALDFIEQTFELLLKAVDIESDTGFELLEDIINE